MCDRSQPEDLGINLDEYIFIDYIDQNDLDNISVKGLYGINKINNSSSCFRWAIVNSIGEWFIIPHTTAS